MEPTATRLLTQRQFAEMLGVTPRSLERWRETGDGPPFLRVGGLVRYAPADVSAWLETRRRTSTSAPADAERAA